MHIKEDVALNHSLRLSYLKATEDLQLLGFLLRLLRLAD